ncbi:MAG TPA: hypothetical protein VF189_05095, partial [Patescibacteria group bacterium]
LVESTRIKIFKVGQIISWSGIIEHMGKEDDKKEDKEEILKRQIILDLPLSVEITQKYVQANSTGNLEKEDRDFLESILEVWDSYYVGNPEYAYGYYSEKDPYGSSVAEDLRDRYNKKLGKNPNSPIAEVVGFIHTIDPLVFKGFDAMDKPKLKINFKKAESKERLGTILGRNL